MSITRRKKHSQETEQVRPEFNWPSDRSIEWCIGQLTEDIRNVLESIRDKQMLQCDVRGDIRKMRIALERIARNFDARPKRGRK